jgi:hypothetical protein
LFRPNYFGLGGFTRFFYSAHYFFPNVADTETVRTMNAGERINCELWRQRCNNVPSVESVYDAVYGSGNDDKNSFVQYLNTKKDTEAIRYLNFARACTQLDDFLTDPWERHKDIYLPQREYYVHDALKLARETKDESIQLRYAFQSIRTAYYADNVVLIKNVYNEFFSNRKKKNIIDYWALYFRALDEPDSAMKNYYLTQVFDHAPDKRFMCNQEWNRKVPIIKVLRLAKTKKEKAAVWLLYNVRNAGPGIESMKQLAALDPNSDGLALLLTREVNKVEDWIFTPYYTNFEPFSRVEETWLDNVPYSKMLKRVEKDRLYAQQVLDFVNLEMPVVKTHPLLWKTSRAYLLFMTKDYASALEQITILENDKSKTKAISDELEMIKALCLVAQQPEGNAIIPDEVKPILLRQFNLQNQKFIFGVAKELEYKGNKTDAALLMSQLNLNGYDWEKSVYWKNKKKSNDEYDDFFTDYFLYMDETFTTDDLNNLIVAIEKRSLQTDTFSIWEIKRVKKQIPRLYDLLGTKYMRENKLKPALNSFEKVNDTLWTSKYAPFSTYLDANPFYADMYSEHSKTKGDTITFNKESVTRTLINYLGKAEDVNNKHRDYYYFLAANCYFNMTQYGNSWIMKRYWTGAGLGGIELPGGHDFFNCDLAKSYYLKAKAVSKSKKFSALCLRMAGRCESYHLSFVRRAGDYDVPYLGNSEKILNANVYYKQMKKQYPDDYEELLGNCNSFKEYFRAGR